ncbi:MAG: DUF554 domain-containing protein, partial [Thermoguttaceae bacterium]
MFPVGALINAVAVLVGSSIGLLLRGKIPEKTSESITRALGLCVCIIGVTGAIKGDIMLLVVSLAFGAFTGELLRLEDGLEKLGMLLQKKFVRKEENSTFVEGFVASTLLFCVGAMAVVGSIDSGLKQEHGVICTKSIIDGVSSMVLASSLGAGVLFSAVAIFIYQGSIEFFAGYLHHYLTDELVTQISAAGSVMILGIGFNMVLG